MTWQEIKNLKNKIKSLILEQILWSEKNLKNKSGHEKKLAVIQKLDDLIKLPEYLEWVDNALLSWLIDAICQKINSSYGHNFTQTLFTESQKESILKNIRFSTPENLENKNMNGGN